MRRFITLFLVGCVVATWSVTGASALTTKRVAAASDFATDTWSDPWDFANAEDLVLEGPGPTMNLIDARISDGLLRFRIASDGYFSPLWGGYPGALYQGRDGALASNSIDARRYDWLSFSAYSSRNVNAGLFWFTCEGLDPACMGGMPIPLRRGWHTYSRAIANDPGYVLPRAWGGRITGLRFAVSPESTATALQFDWMRLTPGDARPFRAMDEGERWYDTNRNRDDNTGARPGWGELECAQCPGQQPYSLGFLPPDTYHFLGQEPGTPIRYTDPSLLIERTPAPEVLDPDVTGGRDYRSATARDPWDMSGPSDVLTIGNADSITYADGGLHATNAPPTQNDPFVWLRVGPGGINGRRYHRLSITSSYDGRFGLDDRPGGGTHGRVLWRDANHGEATVMQTKEWVTYEGVHTLTVDMRDPRIFEDDAGDRYVWGNHGAITALRWDPNEDPGRRRWHLWDVKLAEDDEAYGDRFTIRWRDRQYLPGSETRIYADPRRGGFDGQLIAVVPQRSGTNSYVWNTMAVTPRTYWIHVETVTRSGLSRGSAYATGPLVVR